MKQLRRPSHIASVFLERLQDLEFCDLSPEISLVQLLIEYGLVDRLELSQREFRGKKLKANRRVLELIAKALDRIGEDSPVIKGKRRRLLNGPPAGFRSIGAGPELMIGGDERKICDRDDPFTWIAIRITKRVKLLKVYIRDAGLFLQLAQSSLVKILFWQDEPARNGELILEGRNPPLHQEDLEFALLDREDYDIYRNFHA